MNQATHAGNTYTEIEAMQLFLGGIPDDTKYAVQRIASQSQLWQEEQLQLPPTKCSRLSTVQSRFFVMDEPGVNYEPNRACFTDTASNKRQHSWTQPKRNQDRTSKDYNRNQKDNKTSPKHNRTPKSPAKRKFQPKCPNCGGYHFDECKTHVKQFHSK